jgi:hypothetical protein
MVRVLDLYSHQFKGENSVPSEVLGSIQGIIKITAFIKCFRALIVLKIEIFKFRLIKGKALLFAFRDLP